MINPNLSQPRFQSAKNLSAAYSSQKQSVTFGKEIEESYEVARPQETSTKGEKLALGAWLGGLGGSALVGGLTGGPVGAIGLPVLYWLASTFFALARPH